MPHQDCPTKSQYPRGWRLFIAGLALLGCVNLATAVRAIQLASIYRELAVKFPPLLQAALGLAWGSAFCGLAWRVWRRRNGSDRWVLVVVGVYGLAQIVWWRAFALADYAQRRWPFVVLATVLLAALVAWYVSRPSVRALFRAPESVEPQANGAATDAEGQPTEIPDSMPGVRDRDNEEHC